MIEIDTDIILTRVTRTGDDHSFKITDDITNVAEHFTFDKLVKHSVGRTRSHIKLN